MIDPNFPLIDLHRHLEGNMRLDTFLDLAEKNHIPLPAQDIVGLRPLMQVIGSQTSVMEFIEKIKRMMVVLVNHEACYRLAYENIEDAKKEGIDYIELRFSPWFMAESHNLNPEGVVEAVCDGVESGCRDFGLEVNIIGIISRTYGPEVGWRELEALLTQDDRITALDLAGDELNYPGDLFSKHFKRARDAGWQVTIHAGEIAGPESIWKAIEVLGAKRIGHAVAAIQDYHLLDMMLDNHIGIEACLTSNLQTSTIKSYGDHPLKRFLDIGLRATINSDDPAISGINLNYEYTVAAPAAGLTLEQIHQAQRNSLEIAFLSEEEKKNILQHKV